MLLACPGVLIGAGLIGCVGKYVLPYNWDWSISMVFGSILSATDPVAVVAIFNSLGVSARLTMLISGESLFNDGTAIVLFQLFLEIYMGKEVTIAGLLKFSGWMVFAGPLLGIMFGMMAVYAVGKGCETHYPTDSMIQVVVAMCCAYLSFFIA